MDNVYQLAGDVMASLTALTSLMKLGAVSRLHLMFYISDVCLLSQDDKIKAKYLSIWYFAQCLLIEEHSAKYTSLLYAYE